MQTADLKQPAKAGWKRLCHSAVPQLPRQYREHKKLAPSYDIACNITIQVVTLLTNWFCSIFNRTPVILGEKYGRQTRQLICQNLSKQEFGLRSGLDGWNRFWPFHGTVAPVVFIRSI